MSEVDRELCRKAAAECVLLARVTTDPATKETLLIRAQEWLKLAYSDHDAKFEQLLSEFNDVQVVRPAPVQRQPMQQQQTKAEDDE